MAVPREEAAAGKVAPVAREKATGMDRPSAGQEKAEAPPAPAAEPPPKPIYERILGSYSVDPNLVVYLNPALCTRYCRSGARPAALSEIPANDAARNMAVAHLHRGALLWIDGYGERAYREIMAARHRFAELGDVQGLAHTYEWLGFMFRESRALDQAAEHFSIAYRMFELTGNRAAVERVLGYAERN